MLAAIFVSSGAEAVVNPEKHVAKAKPVTDRLTPLIERANPNLPTDTATLVRINGAVQVVGGVMMLSPAHRLAAATLAASMVPTTLAGHPFWQVEDPVARKQQRTNFFTNVSLMGGLILAAMDTSGKPGLRWRARHLADETNRSVRRAARNTRAKADVARKAARYARHLPG